MAVSSHGARRPHLYTLAREDQPLLVALRPSFELHATTLFPQPLLRPFIQRRTPRRHSPSFKGQASSIRYANMACWSGKLSLLILHIASFRFFRTCLRLKNGNIFKHLIKHDVFQPILQLTTRESKRDNLVSSTCLEYFDYMRRVCILSGCC